MWWSFLQVFTLPQALLFPQACWARLPNTSFFLMCNLTVNPWKIAVNNGLHAHHFDTKDKGSILPYGHSILYVLAANIEQGSSQIVCLRKAFLSTEVLSVSFLFPNKTLTWANFSFSSVVFFLPQLLPLHITKVLCIKTEDVSDSHKNSWTVTARLFLSGKLFRCDYQWQMSRIRDIHFHFRKNELYTFCELPRSTGAAFSREKCLFFSQTWVSLYLSKVLKHSVSKGDCFFLVNSFLFGLEILHPPFPFPVACPWSF